MDETIIMVLLAFFLILVLLVLTLILNFGKKEKKSNALLGDLNKIKEHISK